MRWYKCKGYQGHVGAGRENEVVVFVRENNIISALKKYNQVPTIRRMRKGYKMPSITEAENEDARMLEQLRKKHGIWFYIRR